MESQSRDKVALVVFFGMVILAISGLIGYLMIGHNWNVAASNIDDATGSMEGYTTIVYEGAIDPAQKKAREAEAEDASKEDSLLSLGEAPPESLDLSPGVDEELEPLIESESNSENQSTGSEISSSDVITDVGAVTETVLTLDIDEVVKSYQEKKSMVFKLDTLDTSKYEETTILKKGEKRIGVFSVAETDTAFKIERQVSTLKKYKVDYIVAVVPDPSLVELVSGIDIVISTSDENLFVMGESINDTFYISSPVIGSVGAILISPSGVVSAKTLSAN
ncbi:MAG: alcohol dehydrogenase [Raoultibacter sp.]|jgi:hypothetical protein